MRSLYQRVVHLNLLEVFEQVLVVHGLLSRVQISLFDYIIQAIFDFTQAEYFVNDVINDRGIVNASP
jgi:hypothetical protein